jgi:hypothetical protein
VNIPPVMTVASGSHAALTNHDVRTCPACADVLTPADREFLAHPERWVDVTPAARPRRYRKNRSSVVVSVRLDADEFARVAAAADSQNSYVSAFVRETLLRAIAGLDGT